MSGTATRRPAVLSVREGDQPDEPSVEEEEEDKERNALLVAAERINDLVGYIWRTHAWIWAFLIFFVVTVLFITHWIASATVPWVATNIFQAFSLAMVMPLWCLLPLALIQTVIRDPRSVYFPLFGLISFACLVLLVVELVAVIIQTINNFSSVGAVLTNLDVASAVGIIMALAGCAAMLMFYVPFIFYEITVLARYAQAMTNPQAGGGGRGGRRPGFQRV